MSLNWREIDLVLAELRLAGARLQRITQPDFSRLLLSLYRDREALTVLISLEQGKTRIHRTVSRPANPPAPPRFQQLLQSRLRGGTIVEVEHVHRDRIIRVAIRRGEEEYLLWARLWGGSANVLLTDSGGIIIDAMYRRPKRNEISGSRFDPPEPDEPARSRAQALEVRAFLQTAAGTTAYPSSNAIESYYRERAAEERLERLRREAHKALESREGHLRRRIEELEHKRAERERSDRYKVIADAIMAQLHRIDPGQVWVEAENPYDSAESLQIQLDPGRSAAENAELYYRRYKKARAAAEVAERDLVEAVEALEDTSRRREEITGSDDPARLETLIGRKRRDSPPRERQRERPPGLRFRSAGLQLYLGRTAPENDELLRRHVRGNDLWLHVRDHPGPYVFVKVPKGKSVPLETLLDAGNLALSHSKARSAGRALIQYTQVKNLRRAKEGPRGRVIPYHERTIDIVLDPERLERLRRPDLEEHS